VLNTKAGIVSDVSTGIWPNAVREICLRNVVLSLVQEGNPSLAKSNFGGAGASGSWGDSPTTDPTDQIARDGLIRLVLQQLAEQLRDPYRPDPRNGPRLMFARTVTGN
jgi:hypothetical protein